MEVSNRFHRFHPSGWRKSISLLGHPLWVLVSRIESHTTWISILRTLRAALFWRFFAFKLCQWPPGYPLLSKVTKDQARAQFVEDVHLLHSESIRTSSSSDQWKSSWSKTWKSYGNHKVNSSVPSPSVLRSPKFTILSIICAASGSVPILGTRSRFQTTSQHFFLKSFPCFQSIYLQFVWYLDIPCSQRNIHRP